MTGAVVVEYVVPLFVIACGVLLTSSTVKPAPTNTGLVLGVAVVSPS